MKATRFEKLEDGKYMAEVTDILERTEPWHYIDFVLGIKNIEVTKGFPANISLDDDGNAKTKLTKALIEVFGMSIKIGDDVTVSNIRDHCKGMKCFVLIEQKKAKDGNEYPNVVSMKPFSQPKEE